MEEGSAWKIPFGIWGTGKASELSSNREIRHVTILFTFLCPGKINVSRVQLCQQGEVSEKNVLDEGRASTGQCWDPMELYQGGSDSQGQAAAPAEAPGPLLCPVSAAGASPGLAGAGWWHRTLLGPSQHCGQTVPSSFPGSQEIPVVQELPLWCFLPLVLLRPHADVSEIAHTECLVLLISEELKVNLTPCILPDFIGALFILAELSSVRRSLIRGTKLTAGIKQIHFSTITFY